MPDRLEAGTVVDGRYRIVHRIGSGGMADVYCAEDTQLGRKVALKMLHSRFAEDDEFVERFRREASSAAGLNHQHVVAVYDRGAWDGTYYIAMEHLEGRTLKAIVTQEAPLDPDRAIDLTIQILRAARFAHRRGIIHRDLKPHNVIVDDEDRAKVTDFGIARAGASDMTQTGSIMGTAQYLSPEQAEGRAVSARSDLYSIGVVIYELLTGRVPFEGDSAVAIALKHVSQPPDPPSAYNSAVTPELEAVVLRALEKDPERRFPDAEAFIAALEAARAADPTMATQIVPAGALPPAAVLAAPMPMELAYDDYSYPREPLGDEPPEDRERRGLWWALLVLLVVAAAILAGVLLLGGGGKQIAVPNVVGLERTSAESRMQTAGFSTDVKLAPSDEAQEGTVTEQDPAAGGQAEKGSTVTLTVSSGPERVQIPQLDGLTEKSALQRLDRDGLEGQVQREESDSVDEGRVITSSPRQGEEVDRGSTVILTVSSGPDEVDLPDVRGERFEEARAALRSAGFDVRRVDRESTDEEPDTVLEQDPAGGGTAPDGSTVVLTVAVAPAEVDVPDITGETVGVAVDRLSRDGFDVEQLEQPVDSAEGDGVVIQQDPAGGSAPRGSTVTIVVGRFEDPLGLDEGA